MSRPSTMYSASSSAASSLRQPSFGSHNTQHSAALQARIAAKKDELRNLKELKELSGALAGQMAVLEEKLRTLRDGTEGSTRLHYQAHK